MNSNESSSSSVKRVFLAIFLVLLIPLVLAMILAFSIGAISAIGLGFTLALVAAVGWYVDFRIQRNLIRYILLAFWGILFLIVLQIYMWQWSSSPNWISALLSFVVIVTVGGIEINIFCTQVLQPRLTQLHNETDIDPVTSLQ
jgi:hypothetical protein